MNVQRNTSRAFTRLELTVVLAVVATLLAVLPSLLRSAKDCCLKPQCLHNLKNIALSFQIFATDNGGRFPQQIPAKEDGSQEFTNGHTAFRHFLA